MEEVNLNETAVEETAISEKALNCDSNEPKKTKTPAMFKAGIALMCATSALSLGAIGACGFLGYKLYKNQKNQNSTQQDSMGSVVASKQPTISEDGYWVIDGVKTPFKAEVTDGEDGADGVSVVNASIVNLDKWGITTQIQFKMSDNSYIVTAPQTQIMSEHFYEAEDMSDILTLTEGYDISKIKLSKNVYLSSSIEFAGDTVIDLNRKTLDYVAINPLKVAENSTLTFKNGSVNFKNSVGVSVEGENAELSFEKVTVGATSTVAETLENNASINLTNSTVQTIQQGYGASRSSVGSLFIIKGENANITVTGSKFDTTKSIVSASENATEFKIVVKETKINTTAPILDIDTDEVVPTLDIDNSTMQNSTVTELNTSPITSGKFNVDPTELGATLEGVEQFTVNGATVLAEDLNALVDIIESGSTITLTKDIVISGENVDTEDAKIYVDKNLTLDLNGHSINADFGVGANNFFVFRVIENGKLTINDSVGTGSISGYAITGGYALYVDGGELIVNAGSYTGNPTTINVRTGKAVINGGTFASTYPNEFRYVVNCIDANYKNGTAIVEINGGTFNNFNPANNAAEGVGTNFVAEGKIVAGKGDTYTVTSPDKFAELIADEDVNYISLYSDILLDRGVVVEKELTLNLNDYTISTPEIYELAAIQVNTASGNLTINASEIGGINSASCNNDCSISVWARNGGHAVINGGIYTNKGAYSDYGNGKYANNELIYVSETGVDNSSIVINGGTFIGNSDNKGFGTRYTLNKLDKCDSTITVYGGTFVDYNPSVSKSENPIDNFVASGHFVVKNGLNYTVVAGTLQEVVNKAAANSTIILTEDVVIAGEGIDSEEAKIYISKNLTLDLNGHSINADFGVGANNFFVFRVIANGKLTINDSVGTGSISAYATTGGYALYVDGGELIVNAGSYTGNPTTINVRTGKAVINGGTFASTYPNEFRYVVNCIDANYKNGTAIVEINGGTFNNFNPANNASEGVGTNYTTEGHFVYQVGDNYTVVAGTLQEVVNKAAANSTIILTEDVVIGGEGIDTEESKIYISKNLTLDLNGHSINADFGVGANNFFVFRVIANGKLTINDSVGTGSISAYAITGGYALYVDGGELIVNAGSYTGNPTTINVRTGKAVINGGTFASTYPNEFRYVVNCIDANYKNGTAIVEINGGTFNNFNPANNAAEGVGTNFVAEGYKVVANGDNYTVVAE